MVFRWLYTYLFPIECINCHAIGTYLCADCKKLLTTHPSVCPVCHRITEGGTLCIDCRSESNSHLDGIVIGFRYDSLLKAMIAQLKYHHKHVLASFLAGQLARHIRSHDMLTRYQTSNIVITYVPSHIRRRIRVKGYNQSALLAEELGEQLGIPVKPLVIKSRQTKRQAGLSREKRLSNVSDSFCWNERVSLSNLVTTVMIVDDVTTTGSTLQEVAKAIKSRYPYLTVRGVVVARHG